MITGSLAKYFVGFLFCVAILSAQEPSPSATISRIPLRPHHDESGMPEGAQERQNVPELLPKSNALPGTGARLFDPTPNGDLPNGNVPNGNVIPTPTPTPISPEQQKKNEARFAEIRSSAMQGARPIFLLQESRSALTDEARRNFLRAYYYSVCAEMRRMEPGLKSMVNTYEQEQIASLAKGRSPLVVANVHRSRQRPRTP